MSKNCDSCSIVSLASYSMKILKNFFQSLFPKLKQSVEYASLSANTLRVIYPSVLKIKVNMLFRT